MAAEHYLALIAAGTLEESAALSVSTMQGAMAVLLLDLRRPASRDYWGHWLGKKSGLPEGAMAPHWYRDVDRFGPVWVLEFSAGLHTYRLIFGESAEGWNPSVAKSHFRSVPGISSLIDPAESLGAALLSAHPE